MTDSLTPDDGRRDESDSDQQHTGEQPDEQQSQQQDEHQDDEQQSHESNDDESNDDSDGEPQDWKVEARKWKSEAKRQQRLNQREAGPLQREVDELRTQVADQDSAAVEAASQLAAEQLHTKLARAGLSEQDATNLVEHIDSMNLIEDGKPSPQSIDSLAASLSRSLHRGVDDDQGQRSDGPAFNADDWLRRKARK